MPPFECLVISQINQSVGPKEGNRFRRLDDESRLGQGDGLDLANALATQSFILLDK